jgi:Putative serine esterase (DUF676)
MQVVLIHGLGRTPLSFFSLERRLQQAGHQTQAFGYVAFAESYDRIVQRLRDCLENVSQRGTYSIVAHSLGGVLTRSALSGLDKLPVQIIMMGTPNQPPRLATIAWNVLLFRWIAGQCGANLSSQEFYKTLPPLTSPYTIIAGTAGPTGTFSPFGSDINDGIVALKETWITPRDKIIEFSIFHTFMMNDARVQKTVLKAIEKEL